MPGRHGTPQLCRAAARFLSPDRSKSILTGDLSGEVRVRKCYSGISFKIAAEAFEVPE
jgi:hypothetical protein